MSTILEALRRLEGERREGAPDRDLREEVAMSPGEPWRRERRAGPWIAAGATALIALGVGLAVGGAEEEGELPRLEAGARADVHTESVSRAAPQASRAPAGEAEARREPLAQAREEATPPPEPLGTSGEATGSREALAAAEAAPEPAPPPPARAASPDRASSPGSETAPEPEPEADFGSQLAARPEPEPPPDPAASPDRALSPEPARATPEPGAAEPEPAAATEVAARPAAAERAPAPPAPAPPPPPSVEVRRTVWHPDRGRRVATVAVEGREGTLRLHEGDAVGTLVVERIEPSAVVFLHEGERLEHAVER